MTVRDHVMVAHSLRGAVFGPAQQLHGATFVVEATFQGESLDEDGIVVDIGLAAGALSRALDGLRYRNLDQVPELAGLNTTTEVLARVVADRVADAVHAGELGPAAGRLTGLRVVLRESPDAWASYERAL